VDIRFSRTGRPLFLTMSRHALSQYKTYVWKAAPVTYVGLHPNVYAARGDHALYEKCNTGLGFQLYKADGPIPFWDHTCQGGAIVAVNPPQVTAKLNNAAGTWACWQGKLGNSGPAAPIRQSIAPGVRSLCPPKARGARATSATPVTIPAATDPSLDCRSFESPPSSSGVTAVACDRQDLLDSLSGTAQPALGWSLSSGATLQHDDGPPATAASNDPADSDRLRLTARRGANPEVYVATVRDGMYAFVRFPPHRIEEGESLAVRTPDRGDWTLVDARGQVVATADPHRQVLPDPPAPRGPRPPLPTRVRLKRDGRASTVSWHVSGVTTRNVTFFVVTLPKGRGEASVVTPVARIRGHGQRRFATRIATRKLVGRLIRVVAFRGERSRRSRAIRGPRRR
jgi:hypothetical protein